jgi:hypothetical protein
MNPGSDSFRLVMRRGPSPNQVYDLSADSVTIGRDITNDIVINDPEVSRHHLRFTRGGGGFTMEDLGSTNGTFINGQRMTGSRPLRPGDMIGLGETVTLAYEPAAGPTVAGPAANVAPGAAGATMQTPIQRPPAQPGVSQPFTPGASQVYQAGSQPPGASQTYQPPAQQPPVQPAAPSQPYAPAPGASQQYPPASQPQSPYAPTGASQQYAPAPGQPQQPSQPGQAYPYPAGTGYSQANAPYSGTGQASGLSAYGEYDPYAAGEVKPNNTVRIVAIGCTALAVFCCCGSLAGAVIVDQLCLYQSLPIVYDIIRALGYVAVCP